MIHAKRLFTLALAIAASACSATQLLSTWRDPTVEQVTFKKVLVVAPNRSPALRREAEDELARRIVNAVGVPSYTIVPDAELRDDAAIRARARQGGFDGVVVMRLVAVTREAHWEPGTSVGPYYAYGGWPAYDPGYFQVDTYVRLDTNVYSLPSDKLVWASASRTVNPPSVRELVASTAKAIAKEMQHEHFIP